MQILLERHDAPIDEWGSLLMTYHFPDDPPEKGWYCREAINNALLRWLGDEHVSVFAVLHVVNTILLQMQREIGMLHSG